MIFVDTNYFLRFLLADLNDQHHEARKLFMEAAEGNLKLFTSTIVFFEIYWVLSSFYQKNKTELIVLLRKILDLNFIQFKERQILQKAISLFEKNSLSLEDCYNVYYAKSRKTREFKTFDNKLSKLFKSN